MKRTEVRSDYLDWHKACQNAAANTDNFRATPEFQYIVEGTRLRCGRYHLKKIIKNPHFISVVNDLDKMDLFGLSFRNNGYKKVVSFKLIDSDDKKTKTYQLTPTALRYARNSLNLIKLFGEKILNSINVYEVGGGYGGDLKTFDCITTKLGIPINSWNIYDLETSEDLLKQSCKNVKTKVNYIFNYPNSPISTNSKNLFFSCGAISEMNGKTLHSYLENVVLQCEYGYILANFDSHSKPYDGISTDDFISYLKKNGKQNVQEICPLEFFTPYDTHFGGTRLIIFGADKLYKKPSKSLAIMRYKLASLKSRIANSYRAFFDVY